MSGTLDDRYFEWLYSQFAAVRNRNPAQSYWELSRYLFTREFTWFVPNDDNRVEDGKELRCEFLSEQGDDEFDPEWMDLGCSMLEMLVALARRASFESEATPVTWFGQFLVNMGVDGFTDSEWSDSARSIVDRLTTTVIDRTYLPDGRGGLFPLRQATRDQRKVELWFQMAEYLLESY